MAAGNNEDFDKKLDGEMDTLVESFTHIISSAKIQAKDTFTLAEEGYQIECQATTIVRSCETLLTMISDMKQSLLLNDTRSINSITQRHRDQAKVRIAETHGSFSMVRAEVDQMLSELQGALDASTYVR
ncbi:hypothetical protein IWQ60_003600 [Tieghemiomyces parasiticus]|uniref:Mediator of RNA polymerase II transcription subunit 22 n=1 Tax=Tieghemiomyces parasiticus TaxID=78921 RepID=A0A9W8E028_9FUNG|nr:hypothetical protein IWQ60_003600 [Tieghemiomyces parasiticus]